MLKGRVNQRCIGSGSCVAIAPEVFELDAFGTARVRADCPTEVDADLLWEAARACPVEAIVLEKDGEQVFPD